MNIKISTSIILFVFFISLGCVAKYRVPEGATYNVEFVGKWEGEHFNNEGNYLRKWFQTRNSDGTYELELTYLDSNGKFLDKEIQTGNWWVSNGLFHEISPGRMSKPEIYAFEFIGNDKIEFKSVQLDTSSDEKDSYSFTDKRMIE